MIERELADERLVGLLWRMSCIDDAIRVGYLIGKERMTKKGERKLKELIEDGYLPEIRDQKGDQEQADRIYKRFELER